MRVVRRRLFWKIYITLLASLVAATVVMGAVFWFLGEAQREATPLGSLSDRTTHRVGPRDVSLYDAGGKLIEARGRTIAPAEFAPGHHRGPGHVLRIDLPDGRFVLTRFVPPARVRAMALIALMLVATCGVGLAAYPVTALLTRRLEALRVGVTRWGDGAGTAPVRLDDRGHDEVALLAGTFNNATARIAALLASQKALLANASHELRSPLARLRVAIEVGRDPGAATHAEIVRSLAEIDQLVDELLLSSRLDHAGLDLAGLDRARREPVDLLGLAAEEATRTDAMVGGDPVEIEGDPVLLRRLIRNLLENGLKHGKPPVEVEVRATAAGAEIVVGDAGPGIAAAERDRIFEPFYRPAGAGEGSGGWGLGLALVRQIAERHGGGVACGDAPSGGTHVVVRLARGSSVPSA